MRIDSVRFDPVTESPVLLLEEDAGAKRRLPIWIGPYEARSIAMEMEKLDSPRPNTHDLAVSILDSLGGQLERVVITELRGNTYFAILEIAIGGRTLAVDARPSDAIALALRTGTPVAATAELLERVTLEDPSSSPMDVRWEGVPQESAEPKAGSSVFFL